MTAGSDEVVLFSLDEGIATVTLNRPAEGNALSPDVLVALEAIWTRVNTDRAIRVVVLTAAGDRHFCTGASVGSLAIGQGGLQNEPFAVANRFTSKMMGVAQPVICLVNGLCNGGGLHFISDSDIIIAAASATFLDSHTNVGQVSALESVGVARKAGVGAALLMALVGKSYRMSAERAHQLGLIDLIEPTLDEARERAFELARAIARNSPQALALTKRAIWAATDMPDRQSLDYAWELLKSHWAHPDFEEGPRAFAEKREPRWNSDPNARR